MGNPEDSKLHAFSERSNFDELTFQLDAGRRTEREPIAIVGIGCRFPGGANSPENFWKLLRDGVDAITEVPVDRWHLRAFYDPDPAKPGKTYVRWGGFVKDIDQFDVEFFEISPREAAHMDPQQRLLLEVAYEALEDAGYALESLAGSKAGVFIGISTCDYGVIQSGVTERRSINAYTNLGSGMCIAANRISYLFDFHGPSIAVDTACSSSLVAAYLACQSIWNGECALALTGGVNVILRPEGTIGFSKASMLAPDGRCKSFDARANGYVRSEGAGVVVLKPLSNALADGDLIYAVVRGGAVNQDGRTSGIALPNRSAQESMLREAYRQAGLAPEQVQYVEAHGTGTPIGDPIEVNALGNVLSSHRSAGNDLIIGSVKTNIGHLEAASGVAGLIKAALCVKHRQIPPSLHFQTPNPEIPFESLKLRVPQTLEPWHDTSTEPRLVGVNSFGFGGTNAHVILGAAPEPSDTRLHKDTPLDSRARILPLSARSPEALQAFTRSYLAFLTDEASSAEVSLSDICYTASLRRGHHDHRLAVVAHTKEELTENLGVFLAGETRVSTSSGRQVPGHSYRLAFVFSGMGPQWWAMGRQLLEEEPVFREIIRRCDALLQQHASWSLWDEMTADEKRSRINETQIAQPAVFSLQAALAALWRSWGIEPDVIVGHSVGEVAATHVAGVLNLEDAIRVVFHRSRLQRQVAGQGEMLAVGLSLKEAECALMGYEERISIAAVNSPSDVTLSGDSGVLRKIAESLEQKQVFCRFLQVEVPYHSPKLEPLKAELLESLQELRPQPATIPIFSTATGQAVEGPGLDATYWWQNMRNPVRFAAVIDKIAQADFDLFLEISPHPVLAGSISKCLALGKKEGTILPSLRRHEPERAMMLGSLGRLYTLGYPIDWNQLYPQGGRLVRLPSYPWQRKRYWHESEKAQRERLGQKVHPLLGSQLESAYSAWDVELDKQALAYLDDHRVQDAVVYPAAAYVEMALAAARESFGQVPSVVEEIALQRAIILSDAEPLTVQLICDPGLTSFDIYSYVNGAEPSWVRHATGKLRRLQDGEASEQLRMQEIRGRCPIEISRSDFYQQFHKVGLQYGPCFQGVDRLWVGEGEALGQIQVHAALGIEIQDYLLHPAVLDACFQVLLGAVALKVADVDQVEGVCLPVGIDRVRFYRRPGNKLCSYARLVDQGPTHFTGDIQLLDDEGSVLAEIQGFRCRSMEQGSEKIDRYLYEYRWKLKPRTGQMFASRPSDHMPSPLQMAERLQLEADRLSDQFGLNRYETGEQQINILTGAYILNAFQQLGWEFYLHQPISADSLVEQLGVASQHRRLLRRLLEILGEDGVLEKVDDRWEACQLPEVKDPLEIWKSLWAQFPVFQAEMMLVRQCGERLAEVLRGELDPLQLIFPQGSLTTAEHLYQDAPSYRIYNMLVQKAVAMALAHLPEGQTVRILEIGGGTGGMTSYVLRKLPTDRTEYVFTDVTQLLTTHAEQKFHKYPFVQYQLLDIEKDPITQGFEAHSFDMILASDVLHATRDLRQTLNNVKQLLAPEGLLVLLELTNAPHILNLVFGLLKGWWLFDDDLRVADPWICQEAWQNLLKEVGFSEVACVAETKQAGDPRHTVFLAKGPAVRQEAQPTEAVSPPLEKPGSWLIFADSEGVGQDLAVRLKECGETPILISPGETYQRIDADHFQIRPGQLEDMQQLVEASLASQSECWGIIHTWSLDILPPEETTVSSLESARVLGCVSVLHLVQVLARVDSSEPPRLWLVTSGAQAVGGSDKSVSVAQSPLWGLGKVIVNEYPNLRCKMVDLSPTRSPEESQSLFEELWADDDEDEIVLRGEARYIHRLTRVSLASIQEKAQVKVSAGTSQPFSLEISTPGILDNLTLRTADRREPGFGEIEIEICVTALNFKDVMVAMGLLPEEALEGGYTGRALGMECAGRIVAIGGGVKGFEIGDEVVTSAPGALRTHLTIDAHFVTHKPPHLSFEEAATIPIAFLTAYYSLCELGQMRKGDRVLIHAAAGGVGLAAIQFAQRAGAEVFATAGTQLKRDLLRALGVSHVMDSRSLAFADEVMEHTNGKGIDIVLNSLAGEAIHKSFSVLSSYGRFIEIGKMDIYQNSKLELRPFRNNISYFAVDLDRLCAERPDFVRSLLHEVMQGFADGTLHPLPHRVFPISEVVNAFQYMAQAKHIGKVVVSLQDPEVVVAPSPKKSVSFHADGTYLITGGLGGFGLAVAQWLVEHGAQHLVLMGRCGAPSTEANSAIKALQEAGVQVVVAKADVTREEQVAQVLANIRESMPPLRGIIHAAMVLDDALLHQLNEERMRKVMAPKVTGAWNLHTQTLDMPLDFFVLFSSFGSVIGNAGQGNYVAANAFLDALAYHRSARDLPALTVNWGAVADVGYVAQNPEIGQMLDQLGLRSLPVQKMLEILGELIQQEGVQIGVGHMDWQQLARMQIIGRSPRFVHLVEAVLTEDEEDAGAWFIDALMAIEQGERQQFLESHIREQVARVLGTSPSKVDVEKPLLNLGLDSLMAVEVGNQIQIQVGVDVPPVKLMEGLSVAGMAAFVIEQLTEVGSASDAVATPKADVKVLTASDLSQETADQLLAKVDQLSDEEVDSLLREVVDEKLTETK